MNRSASLFAPLLLFPGWLSAQPAIAINADDLLVFGSETCEISAGSANYETRILAVDCTSLEHDVRKRRSVVYSTGSSDYVGWTVAVSVAGDDPDSMWFGPCEIFVILANDPGAYWTADCQPPPFRDGFDLSATVSQ